MKSKITLGILAAAAALLSAPELIAQTCVGPQPTICTRSCWSARSPNCTLYTMSALTRAIIHHTAAASDWDTTSIDTSKPKMRSIQNYHMDTQGWCDIGYHFVVDKLGNIFEGRSGSMSILRRGIHDACNNNSFGFTLMGYCHSPYNHNPDSNCRGKIYATIAWRMPGGWSPYGSGTYCSKTVGTLDGHRKVTATACPGDVFFNNYIGSSYTSGDARTGVASRRACSSSTSVIVDNSDSGFSVTGTWATGTSSTDKYGTDYRYHSTAAVSEPAQWLASVSGTRNVAAWWAQGSNRSATAAYHVYHSGGTTIVTVNQQANGGKWNSLGNFDMTTGKVLLSVWTATGYIVVADAIKWQ